ncbi:hypothetical protein KSF73_03280 [Burkholderiaceae bacterium DAT-1]|nr:hypothetical protein [Burkholderiaceae bacterium DAT-1]
MKSPFRQLLTRFGYQNKRRLVTDLSGEAILGARDVILGRNLLHFSSFDMRGVPAKLLASAIRLRIGAWAPSPQSDAIYAIRNGWVMVWCWDKPVGDLTASALAEATVVPECLLHEHRQDGTYLLACRSGFEAQIWHEGVLKYSRWWSVEPDAQDVTRFLRGVSGIPADILRVPSKVQASEEQFHTGFKLIRLGDAIRVVSTFEFAIYVLAYACMVAALAFSLNRKWVLDKEVAALEEQVDQASASVRSLVKSQEAAVAANAQLTQLRELYRQPLKVAILADVAKVIPLGSAQVKIIQIDQDKLKIVLAPSEGVTSAKVIDWFNAMPGIKNVKVVSYEDTRQLGVFADLGTNGAENQPEVRS